MSYGIIHITYRKSKLPLTPEKQNAVSAVLSYITPVGPKNLINQPKEDIQGKNTFIC
jgi:hypothetical protein